MTDEQLPRVGEPVLIYTRLSSFTHAVWNGETFVDMRGNVLQPEEVLSWEPLDEDEDILYFHQEL